ncbi:hypothetical protein HPB50_002773 [Hyalomma asiaticum]|uniref:Uncharacterized protein n=1 Tax=Hyalomma asiaticum TaxID=266040 RepID=A0ACB7S4K7_HYAAI|nr:hypothetical protein HPB50_002773 [Hyalomma asiaticum]
MYSLRFGRGRKRPVARLVPQPKRKEYILFFDRLPLPHSGQRRDFCNQPIAAYVVLLLRGECLGRVEPLEDTPVIDAPDDTHCSSSSTLTVWYVLPVASVAAPYTSENNPIEK